MFNEALAARKFEKYVCVGGSVEAGRRRSIEKELDVEVMRNEKVETEIAVVKE